MGNDMMHPMMCEPGMQWGPPRSCPRGPRDCPRGPEGCWRSTRRSPRAMRQRWRLWHVGAPHPVLPCRGAQAEWALGSLGSSAPLQADGRPSRSPLGPWILPWRDAANGGPYATHVEPTPQLLAARRRGVC